MKPNRGAPLPANIFAGSIFSFVSAMRTAMMYPHRSEKNLHSIMRVMLGSKF